MKLGIFTDAHYSSADRTEGVRLNKQSLAKIKTAMDHFKKEKCDLVICLGDLTDHEDDHLLEISNLTEISEVFKLSGMNIIAVMGNHDAFSFEVSEFYSVLGEEFRPHTVSFGNKSLIFIDACHFKTGVHYQPGDSDWEDTFYPYCDELEKQISETEGNVYLFMHQDIDPAISEDHRLYNSEELFNIVKNSGKVKGVYQGHYHGGKTSEYDGIEFIAFPAMCETENYCFIIEKE